MAHSITFYPVGNGDTTQIVTDQGKRILLDYRQHSNAESADFPVMDIRSTLKEELSSDDQNFFDVVAFTHADNDHIQGSTEFFEFDYTAKYQGDDRIKIKELWVPAAMLLEAADNDKQSEEFVILRQEARHRLINDYGIKVFSKPDDLVTFMQEKGLGPNDRDHRIVDAGSLVDTFSLSNDGIEFFCHSPFMKHCDASDKKTIRNEASLIFNVRLAAGSRTYDFMAIGDSEYEVLSDIVSITQFKGNEDRLEWNLFSLPHHCSYLALSDEKGTRQTIPKPKVEELLLKGRQNSYMISSSRPIDTDHVAYEQIQPPHIQAKNCYQSYLSKVLGRRLIVTMEEPSPLKPKPVKFEVSSMGLSLAVPMLTGAGLALQSKPARAGIHD